MRYITLAVCALLMLAGCKDKTGEISGTVSYLQRIKLPPDAFLSVRLEDMSAADASSSLVAETKQATNGSQVPIAYHLTYSVSDIQRSHRYQLRATLSSKEGEVLFTTTQPPPINPEGGTVEMGILLQPVPPHAQSLEHIQWQLVAMGETLLPGHDGDSGAYLLLQPDGQKMSGSTGCNRFFGTYSLSGVQLSFGAIGMTKMACEPALMEQEQSFVAALGKADTYSVRGSVLELLSGGTALLRFEAGAKQ